MAPALVGQVWPLVQGRFSKVFERFRSDLTFDVLEDEVLHGDHLLWIGVRDGEIVAGGVTALFQTPARKICTIVAAFGVNTRLWGKFIPMIEEYARAEGCASVRVEGRRGWARVLKGFEEPWVVLDKELN